MTSVQQYARAATAGTQPAFPGGIDGLILDCDGVLFDSKKANTAYYNHIRFAVQLPPMTEDEASYSHMASTDEALERMIPDGLKDEARRAREATLYRDTFMSMMEPFPFVYDFLNSMKATGLRLALCTNRSDSVHSVLAHFGMSDFFSQVMTITHAKPKPAPEGLTKVTARWGVPSGRVAFLGDSLVDQQAAAAAGMPFWSFNNPGLHAEVHVTGFKELGDIMQLVLVQ